jgi:hypothetical protein
MSHVVSKCSTAEKEGTETDKSLPQAIWGDHPAGNAREPIRNVPAIGTC